jgi:hypothetical protein
VRATALPDIEGRYLPFAPSHLVEIKGKNPPTMLAPYLQQFATGGQEIDLLRFLVELLGK